MKAAKSSTKVTKEISQKQKNRATTIRLILVSLILAIIVFVALLVIQSNILDKKETAYVAVVLQDITSGTKLTEENIDEYVGIQEQIIDYLPENYVTDKSLLIDKFIDKDYKAKDIITIDKVTDSAYAIDEINKPIEVAFSASSLENAVSGILREGDRVNVYSIQTYNIYDYTTGNQTSTESVLLMKHAYITKAFTAGGEEISTADRVTNATMYNIVISEDVEQAFNEAVNQGTLRLSKVLYLEKDADGSIKTPTNKDGGFVK